MHTTALLIGNSDGIGLATTRRLLSEGWSAIGVSRSDSPVESASYTHHVSDVTSLQYVRLLDRLAGDQLIDLCIYFAGIGEPIDLADMSAEVRVIEVNLLGLVRTCAGVIPGMVKRSRGHFIGISSLADELLSAEAPSYHASKAGFSSYLRSLALTLKSTGVSVTNVRFGFVDTKMAKGDRKPLMMTVDRAVNHIERCIRHRPTEYVAPQAAIPLVKLRKWTMRFTQK
ncbi:MAG: SDR family NAD(P)-dependent oxidoreductase [Bradymonadales bacterium]|nr:SDR family NAD(P)-dependent oxidoreductase [Bradymonadales bacterium]